MAANEYTVPASVLTEIADAIRYKTGGTGSISPAQMAEEIRSIEGGGPSVDLQTLNVSSNGTTDAPTGVAYNKVIAAVPNSYSASDEGKVVSGGALVPQTAVTLTENGAYDTTLNDSVTVETAAAAYISSATGLAYMFETANGMPLPSPRPPQEMNISAPNCYNISNMFHQYQATAAYNLGIKKVTLDLRFSSVIAANGFLNRNTSIEEITFLADVVRIGAGYNFASDASGIKIINGELNFTQATSTNYSNFLAASSLQEIRLSKGCVAYTTRLNSQNLTDASLVSIANALSSNVSGMTLTHNATAKARCGQIVGTVSDGVFTQDATGGVTLTDFITNTKGWTLA